MNKAVMSEVLFEHLRKIIDIPERCTELNISLKKGELAIVEATQYAALKDDPVFVKRFKLVDADD